jgi:hypothetical protein
VIPRIFVLSAALALLMPLPARGDFHMFSPNQIDLGQLEIEHNGSAARGSTNARPANTSRTSAATSNTANR